MTTVRSPACMKCRHFNYQLGQGLECKAFPDGIPDKILFGYDHRKPYPGDGGIRYEPFTDEELRKQGREHLIGWDPFAR